MSKSIQKIFSVVILVILFSLNILPLFTSSVGAQEPFVESEARRMLSDLAKNVVDGKKVSIKKTVKADQKGAIANKFVAFIIKDKVNSVLKNVDAKSSFISENTYGEVVAVPMMFENTAKSNEELMKLDANPDVIAITQAVKRELFEVPVPNDPLFSATDVYDTNLQWNVNKSTGGNYGIDLYSAWEYLDSQAKDWQGTDVVVAVIDTGVAYEDGTKYGTWDFTKPTEMNDNLYVNAGETAGNGIDDDANGRLEDYLLSPGVKYCLDSNDNGICESPEERTKGIIDDVNSFSVVDYMWYWDPYNELTSPYCTNAPYTDYRCVAQRYCETISPPNMDYWGCYNGDMSKAYDINGHGTAVTNVISSKVGNSVGTVGIAPNVKILPISLFAYYYNSGTWSDLIGGDSVGVATAVEYAVSAGAQVVNMSFGGTGYDLFEELVMNRAYYEDDVLLVAASGNIGSAGDVAMYPATYKSVMSVGATNMNGTKTSYSVSKSDVEVSAPVGAGIYTQSYTCYFTQNCVVDGDNTHGSPNRYGQFSIARTAGTSFAAPQVAGVAAMLMSAYPERSASNIRNIIKLSSTQIGSRYNSSIGYGVLNAYNAVRLVDSRGQSVSKQMATVQATRGTDGKLKTRYSLDGGIRWTSWVTGYANYDEVGMPSNIDTNKFIMYVRGYKNQLWQTIGKVENDKLVTESFSRMSYSLSSPRAYLFDNMLLLMFRGTSSVGLNRVMYRRSTTLASSWVRWINTGYSTHPINMAQDPVSKKLVQTTRGTNGRVMTRLFIQNGNGWYGWVSSNYTTGEVTVVRAGSYFIQAMRGTDGYLYTRRSTDGKAWSSWLRSIRMINDAAMVYTGSRVYQAVRGSDNKVYLRYSTNSGRTWTAFAYNGITSKTSPTLHYDKEYNRLFFSTVHTNGKVYTRVSDNGGVNWYPWEAGISASKDVTFSSITYDDGTNEVE